MDEVEVNDPTHPLFGKRFTILSIPRHSKGPNNILVRYKEAMVLQIPLAATTLATLTTYQIRTKLNLPAVNELLAIAKDCEALICPSALEVSGKESQKTCKTKSCKRSHSSVRR